VSAVEAVTDVREVGGHFFAQVEGFAEFADTVWGEGYGFVVEIGGGPFSEWACVRLFEAQIVHMAGEGPVGDRFQVVDAAPVDEGVIEHIVSGSMTGVVEAGDARADEHVRS